MSIEIYGFNSMDLYIPEDTIRVLLLNEGKAPGIDPASMRLFGYSETLKWPDGSVRPGVLQPLTIWYIKGAERKILVDTGASAEGVEQANEAFRRRDQGQVYVKEKRHDIEAFLNRLGTSSEEIELVILTHLHLDHFLNIGAYRRARFLVQKDEILWGMFPPPYAEFHWKEFSRSLFNVAERIEIVDGNKPICPGVEVIRVGGHTAGSQVIAVDTDIGRAIIAGDFFYNYRNIEHSWPVGSFYRLDEWVRNCAYLKSLSNIIVPTHDFYFWELFKDGRIG